MKKKMSNRRFMSIWIPIVSVMVVLAIGANIAGSVFGGILDTSLGRGERHVLHLENVANWDTEYYPQQYTTLAQAREAAERKMYEVVSEGMVLLKNDGVLPLEKGSLWPWLCASHLQRQCDRRLHQVYLPGGWHHPPAGTGASVYADQRCCG